MQMMFPTFLNKKKLNDSTDHLLSKKENKKTRIEKCQILPSFLLRK